MKIEQVKFENIGLLNGEYSLKGNSVIVIAENGSGKTTFCEAFSRVCNSAMPKDIVSKGAVNGKCTFTLSDGSVLDWSKAADKDKPVITFTSAEGKVSKPTQKALKELVGSDFDINRDFINATPKEQKAFIARVSGLDFAELDANIKTAEENRTYIKRSCKEAEARASGANPALAGKELIDVDSISAQIETLAAKEARQKEQAAAMDKLNARKAAIEAEFEAMKAKFEALKKEQGKIIQDLARGEKALSEHQNLSDEISKLKAERTEAQTQNQAIQAARSKQADVQAFIEKQNEVRFAEEAVEQARKEKIAAVKAAKFPADLIAGEDGASLYFTDKNGQQIALESANEAQKTIIGLKIGLGQLGEVKAMSVDVSHLDKKNRQLVFDWADENGLQLFAEKVSDDEGMIVEILNN